MTDNENEAVTKTAIFFLIGFLIGLGDALQQGKESVSQAVGGAIVMGGMAMAAGIIVIWIPNVPFIAQLGISGFLGSIGLSTIRRIVRRRLENSSDD